MKSKQLVLYVFLSFLTWQLATRIHLSWGLGVHESFIHMPIKYAIQLVFSIHAIVKSWSMLFSTTTWLLERRINYTLSSYYVMRWYKEIRFFKTMTSRTSFFSLSIYICIQVWIRWIWMPDLCLIMHIKMFRYFFAQNNHEYNLW